MATRHPASCRGGKTARRSAGQNEQWIAAASCNRSGRQPTHDHAEALAISEAGSEATRYLEGTLPNGLAFARNGDILISNFGTDCLEMMTRDGDSRVLADTIDGEPIGKVNFVLRDSKDRIWITVSTRIKNWMHALRTDLADGYLARYEDGTFRIVADGFRFTNEIRFDAKEEFLYVVETTGGCITRLRIDERRRIRASARSSGPRSLGKGAWPDGIAFDSYGNLWGTLVYSDKLFVLTPQGDMRVLLDEGDPAKGGRAGAGLLQRNQSRRTCSSRPAAASRPGWRASRSAARTCKPSTSARCRDRAFRISARRSPGLPMVHWNRKKKKKKKKKKCNSYGI